MLVFKKCGARFLDIYDYVYFLCMEGHSLVSDIVVYPFIPNSQEQKNGNKCTTEGWHLKDKRRHLRGDILDPGGSEMCVRLNIAYADNIELPWIRLLNMTNSAKNVFVEILSRQQMSL